MQRKAFTGLLLLPLLNCGCSTMNNTESGAVTGGVLGAGAGALLGAAVRAPVAGALIGGTAGALLGGTAGNQQDRAEAHATAVQQAAANQAAAQAATPPSPSLEEIAAMRQNGVSDTLIINAVRQSPGGYVLGSQHILWLKQQGVSEQVISEMQAHPPRAYGPPPGGAYMIDGPPPPPPVVGVGYGYGGYYYRRRGWW